MDQSQFRFAFDKSVPMAEVKATLRLAPLAVVSLHGEDRARLEIRTRVDRAGRVCVIDTMTDVGRTLAAVFAGYVRREFRPEAVEMDRLTEQPSGPAAAAGRTGLPRVKR